MSAALRGRWLPAAAGGLLPFLYLLLLRWFTAAPFDLADAAALALFTAAVLAAGLLLAAARDERGRWRAPWGALALLALAAACLPFALRGNTPLAWVGLAAFYGSSLALAPALLAARRPAGWILTLLFAAALGAIPILLLEIQTRFSDEEFFVAVEAAALALYWLLLWAGVALLRRTAFRPPSANGPAVPRGALWTAAALIGLAAGGAGIWHYQHTFYTPTAPAYPGISADEPFQCGVAANPAAPADPVAASAVYQKYLALLAAKPTKTISDEAVLFLGSGDTRWAQAFRADLLAEARAGRFAGPANSVKSIQFEASGRVYFYTQVRQAAPELFTPEEQALVKSWFQAINRRALTVEWVDWMYALAFAKPPEGPYENQENGAGLLALIEKYGYSDAALSARNRAYLAANPRGWQERFRNTDDAIVYQPEWLDNALYQYEYTGQASPQYLQQSFEWLLLQALPDARSPRYNHPGKPSLISTFYLAASLLHDPGYLWLADRGYDYLLARDGYPMAQPGIDPDLQLEAQPLDVGSCLLYGGSGLPNQIGPLAPDKIVFRDGWNSADTYLMLNLRFTGWHRYKATNSIVLLDQGGPLVVEDFSGQPFRWLPAGRSLFRDKRIPRENLNGLLVARQGLDAVLETLTGVGGAWAQDPPFYATVERFATGAGLDYSRTSIQDWNGWDQQRSIFFYHNGPVVVYDQASGPAGSRAGVSWNVAGAGTADPGRFVLDNGSRKVEMVLVGAGGGAIEAGAAGGESLPVIYHAPAGGQLRLATVFLGPQWAGAAVSLSAGEVEIRLGERRCVVPLREPVGEELGRGCGG